LIGRHGCHWLVGTGQSGIYPYISGINSCVSYLKLTNASGIAFNVIQMRLDSVLALY